MVVDQERYKYKGLLGIFGVIDVAAYFTDLSGALAGAVFGCAKEDGRFVFNGSEFLLSVSDSDVPSITILHQGPSGISASSIPMIYARLDKLLTAAANVACD